MDYPGKLIRKTPLVPTQTSASGVWTMTEAMDAVKANSWPVAGIPKPMQQSLRFRGSSVNAYLNRTPSVTGNRQIMTFSMWFKRGKLAVGAPLFSAGIDNVNTDSMVFNSNDQLAFFTNGTSDSYILTTQVFRDPSAWYHLVFAIDTTQATSSNRYKMYINGVQVTTFSTATYPSQNYNLPKLNNSSYVQGFGTQGAQYWDGEMAEINFIDGQALTPSSFGRTDPITGVWQAIPYTGTYGTNGFYLNFSNNASTATLGYDTSGNANNWTTNNFSLTAGSTYDSMADVPTAWLPAGTLNSNSNVRGNYCVMNPLFYQLGGANFSALSNANLTITGTSSANSGGSIGTMSSTTGKFYYEFNMVGVDASGYCIVGASDVDQLATLTSYNYLGYGSKSYGYNSSGNKTNNNGNASYGASYTTNDIISVALDCTNGAIYFAKNGVWQASGDPTSGASKTNAAYTWTAGSQNMIPQMDVYRTGSIMATNFGQRPFSYTPPSGFLPLNTYNLPASTIVQGNTVMDATLYTGNGTTQAIVNAAGFKPDFVWSKNRSNARNSALVDSVRGATLQLISNTTSAEFTGGFSSFNSNGFSVNNNFNENNTGETYVGWQWQAGQGTTSSNTSGSITSTVSVNASAGFSIVTYTGNGSAGATVGHGLGVTPSLIIAKKRSSTGSWQVYASAISNMASGYITLNGTPGFDTGTSTIWNNTAPTSSVFTLGTDTDANANGATTVAYCWAEVAGFSKFGSYTGNASTDGPFVYCGFRPAFVMTKKSSGSGDWYMWDNKRIISANGDAGLLYAQSALAESDYNAAGIDLLSNGFKIRNSDSSDNGSGSTMIYMAFAENPFKNALAR